MPKLGRLTNLTLTTSDATALPARPPSCDEYGERQDCPILGYRTEFTIQLNGAPAATAGSVFSLLSDLGGEEVDLVEYGLSDWESARREAAAAAVTDARSKADAIAAASGATVTALAKANFEVLSEEDDEQAPVAIRLGSPEVTPKIAVLLTPGPIKVSAAVQATYAIE